MRLAVAAAVWVGKWVGHSLPRRNRTKSALERDKVADPVAAIIKIDPLPKIKNQRLMTLLGRKSIAR